MSAGQDNWLLLILLEWQIQVNRFFNYLPFLGSRFILEELWHCICKLISFSFGLFTSSIGLQLSTEELMNTMPLRDTVAGEALSMLCGSKTTLQLGAIGMRSPFASVRVLLSSKTEFRFSIQMASTGPSRTIQMCSPERKNTCENDTFNLIDLVL